MGFVGWMGKSLGEERPSEALDRWKNWSSSQNSGHCWGNLFDPSTSQLLSWACRYQVRRYLNTLTHESIVPVLLEARNRCTIEFWHSITRSVSTSCRPNQPSLRQGIFHKRWFQTNLLFRVDISCNLRLDHPENEIDWVVPFRVGRKCDCHELSVEQKLPHVRFRMDIWVVENEHKFSSVLIKIGLSLFIKPSVLQSQHIF